jgi:hypothetical protein
VARSANSHVILRVFCVLCVSMVNVCASAETFALHGFVTARGIMRVHEDVLDGLPVRAELRVGDGCRRAEVWSDAGGIEATEASAHP